MPGEEALRAVLVVDLAVDLDQLAERPVPNQHLVGAKEALALGLVELALVLALADLLEPVRQLEVTSNLRVERPQHLRERDHLRHGHVAVPHGALPLLGSHRCHTNRPPSARLAGEAAGGPETLPPAAPQAPRP